MNSLLSVMLKVHPPLAGEGCRGAIDPLYLRGISCYSGGHGGKTEGGAIPQDNGGTANVGVSACETL